MLKLGIIQMSVLEGDIQKNCRRIEEHTRNHVSSDIDLLCFPELCVSGYDFKRAAEYDGEETFFSELAAACHIPILAGIQMKEGDRRYDTACIWDDNGQLLGTYKKIHLWDTENDFFDRGEELVTVPFKGWNIGLLICADFGFPEVSAALAQKKNADVLIYPSAWGAGWEDLFTTCGKMRAAENQVYTVALNRASGDVSYCGSTTVSNPDGTTLARMETTDEAFARVVLKKECLEKAREGIPWRKMRRDDVYSRM